MAPTCHWQYQNALGFPALSSCFLGYLSGYTDFPEVSKPNRNKAYFDVVQVHLSNTFQEVQGRTEARISPRENAGFLLAERFWRPLKSGTLSGMVATGTLLRGF